MEEVISHEIKYSKFFQFLAHFLCTYACTCLSTLSFLMHSRFCVRVDWALLLI